MEQYRKTDSETAGQRQTTAAFAVGFCPVCDRDVLTARQLVDDQLANVCLHCDHEFDQQDLQWWSARRVSKLGYVIDGYDDGECDTHGGCRDGSCGVQQPERG